MEIYYHDVQIFHITKMAPTKMNNDNRTSLWSIIMYLKERNLSKKRKKKKSTGDKHDISQLIK